MVWLFVLEYKGSYKSVSFGYATVSFRNGTEFDGKMEKNT